MPVSADIVLNSLYTYRNTSNLTISGKEATCKTIVDGYIGETTKISFAQTLQKKNSSGSWSTVKTWSKTVNDYSYTYTNKYSGLAKGTYRVKTSATVYSGNKSEVVTSYSAEKTVK